MNSQHLRNAFEMLVDWFERANAVAVGVFVEPVTGKVKVW